MMTMTGRFVVKATIKTARVEVQKKLERREKHDAQ